MKSVNWEAGMLLTPEQFLHQDRCVDEAAGWALRHLMGASGLVGGGVRAAAAPERIPDFDPVVPVQDDGELVHVTVQSVRGVTPSGRVVEIAPADAVPKSFLKGELGWANELFVSVVHTGEMERDPGSSAADDPIDETLPLRRVRYEVRLTPAAHEIEHALMVRRLRRPGNSPKFEPDDSFIPPCVSVAAHSRLYHAWDEFQEQLDGLALGAAHLHHQAARLLAALRRVGVPAPFDEEVLAFVERMADALDACARETSDPAAPPWHLFLHLARLDRRVARALALPACQRELLELVPEAAKWADPETARAWTSPAAWRGAQARHDLAESVEEAQQALNRLARLLPEIHKRYLDYRLTPLLAGLPAWVDLDQNGNFDRDRVYVRCVRSAPASTLAGDGADTRTFSFGALALGPGKYRVALAGTPDGIPGHTHSDGIHLSVAVNGTARPSEQTARWELEGQRNLAFPIEVPEGGLSSLDVSVREGAWFHAAVLCRLADGSSLASPPLTWAPAAEAQPRADTGERAGTQGSSKDILRIPVNPR